ncbi:unnamed protein product [Ilex paraguariensis]|uniref:Uncharacterized protein n=1 Tax=Ilex paraguariensis TaxID=185542 RepID=A0ABC8RFW9_9AQUA
MGSFSSPPPTTLEPSLENSTSRYRVYASFYFREPGHNIYVSNWIGCYDPSNNTWSYVSPIFGLIENHVLKDFAMTSNGDSIYIIGGRLCNKKRALYSNDISEVDVEVLSSVLCYNVHTDQWSTCAPLNVPRYDFACTVCDNKIYVAGGQSTLASARGTSSAEMYDPSRDKWTPLPNMSTSSSTEVYDEQRRKGDLVSRMWQLDVPPNQIVAVDDKLFSSGYCLNAWKGHIETYDGKLNIWYIVEGSQQKLPCTSCINGENRSRVQRLYLTMAPIGTCLFFLAGYRMAGESSE